MAAIGVFDSGVGGLSILQAVRRTLPAHDLIYVADSAYAPYGDQSDEYIRDRTLAVASFLTTRGIAAMVVACNTATAVAIDALRASLTIPVVGIEPGVKPAVALTTSKVVGVLATRRTVESSKFKALLEHQPAGIRVLAQGCPGLVERVERGELDTLETRQLVARYVDPLIAAGADVLVIGCTHYAFLKSVIQEVAGGERVRLVDPADAVARQLARRLSETNDTERRAGTGTTSFWTTADPAELAPVISRLWGTAVQVQRAADLISPVGGIIPPVGGTAG